MPKVLLVDDEPSNLELAQALVSQEGYQVILASDGEIAWQMVQESRPDLVMLDIVMPKMNGLEACRKIKTNPLTYSIPVIIVTALNSPEEKIKAIKAGADDFIGKPFDRLELSARLKSLLRLKAIHDRLETSLVSLKEMQNVREELLTRAAKDVENPLKAIGDCLQSVAAEQHLLSPAVAQKLESALFCVDMVTTMTADFANIMKMEQDKLRLAYESLKPQEPPATQ
jgi:two-component system, sensor histidine kinase and response regulator